MIRSFFAAALLLVLAVSAAGQTAQEVCDFIQNELNVSQGLKSTLCQDFQAGISRGHIQPERAYQLLEGINERIASGTQSAAENILTTIGWTVNPAKGDLPAEALIRRIFEVFNKGQSSEEAMETAARETTALSKALQSVAQVYRGLGISLEPNASKKVIQTDFGEVELTVGRVDTVITATVVALDRFERRLDRSLDDFAGMKAEVMQELRAPSFYGAEPLPNALIQYIDAETEGDEHWAPIVRQLAADRGRTS